MGGCFGLWNRFEFGAIDGEFQEFLRETGKQINNAAGPPLGHQNTLAGTMGGH